MQNPILRTALAVALFASPLAAMADSASVSQNGAFISVTAGKSHFDIDHGPVGATNDTRQDRNDTGFGVLGGYRWVVSRPFSLGVEAGYVNLGKASWRLDRGGLSMHHSLNEETKTDAVLLGINGKWDLPYDLRLMAHVGVAHLRTRSNGAVNDRYIGIYDITRHYRHTSFDNRVYGGIGVGYDFEENLGVALTFDRYSFKPNGEGDNGRTAHANLFGISAEYRF
ncbi:hypothetical protein KCV01_g14984, partial [Aureobasidium melanogenum]